MSKRVDKIFLNKLKFKREFKRQARLLIIVTLGFTIAFTWRQTVFDLSLAVVRFITHFESTSALSILASILITILSLSLIYLTSYWLRDSLENC